MLIIALTGGIACGKTTVAAHLQALGAQIIDADEISRSLTAPGGAALVAIRKAFGDCVFESETVLDRKALASVVFSNEQKRLQLNAILHPMIESEMDRRIGLCRKNGAQAVVLDVPLLFEAGMEHMGDVIVCVSVSQEEQIRRMAVRNGYTREEALSRIRSQWPLEEKRRRSDVVIDTDRPMEDVQKQVSDLYESWLRDRDGEEMT